MKNKLIILAMTILMFAYYKIGLWRGRILERSSSSVEVVVKSSKGMEVMEYFEGDTIMVFNNAFWLKGPVSSKK